MAYDFVHESEYHRYQVICSEILKSTCSLLKKKGISAQPALVGSGKRNMVTRNGDGPYDLDYNLLIAKTTEKWSDPRKLKDAVRVGIDQVAHQKGFAFAQDSTSALTVIKQYRGSSKAEFKFDVAIVRKKDNGNLERLIHDKLGNRLFWNEIPNSRDVKKRAETLRADDCLWEKVREAYRNKKNICLTGMWIERKPSFVLYVEAVNEVYNAYVGGFLM